jgi:hypothetical protein
MAQSEFKPQYCQKQKSQRKEKPEVHPLKIRMTKCFPFKEKRKLHPSFLLPCQYKLQLNRFWGTLFWTRYTSSRKTKLNRQDKVLENIQGVVLQQIKYPSGPCCGNTMDVFTHTKTAKTPPGHIILWDHHVAQQWPRRCYEGPDCMR